MNIDISNAHCGPRILFLDHSWLRVVSYTKTARFPPAGNVGACWTRDATPPPPGGRRRGVPNRESGAPERTARDTSASERADGGGPGARHRDVMRFSVSKARSSLARSRNSGPRFVRARSGKRGRRVRENRD